MEMTIARHCVGCDPETGLSPMQTQIMTAPKPVRIVSAPTGAGKSYAFKQAMLNDERVLFIVPTRRLAQNLISGLLDDLVTQDGWTEEQAGAKITMWSSDATRDLMKAGEMHIGARRCREIHTLDMTRKGGEMIVAVPEVVAGLLLRSYLDAGLSSIGIFDVAECFDHVVFDEFHTVSARGFGLSAVCALLAAQWPGSRMKVTFLSATPLDITPVLEKSGVNPDKDIAYISEPLSASEGRPVHGYVRLSLYEACDMTDLLEKHLDEVASQIAAGQMVVLIFDELRGLQLQLSGLSRLLAGIGLQSGEALVINSLDDSRANTAPDGFFHSGRHRDPRNYKVLVATSSVEMGVTFRTNLLFMEPGFLPMNFLQRYGRAARGDMDGHVVVRISEHSQKLAWFNKLQKFVAAHTGKTISISMLTEILTQKIRKTFRPQPEETCFGALSNRAAYAAGLFWHALIEHLSMKGYQAAHLRKLQPVTGRRIHALLAKVRKMEQDPMFGRTAINWCRRFEAEARTLRDIGPKIRVKEPDGGNFKVLEEWLQKNTDILTRCPVCEGKDGLPEVHLKKTYETYLLDKKNYVKRQVEAVFPHSEYTQWLNAGEELVDHWCRSFKDLRMDTGAWEYWPESMQAALDLVRLTGLVVSNETVGMEAGAQVL
jgi:CRISPR-associated helicase Cas3